MKNAVIYTAAAKNAGYIAWCKANYKKIDAKITGMIHYSF